MMTVLTIPETVAVTTTMTIDWEKLITRLASALVIALCAYALSARDATVKFRTQYTSDMRALSVKIDNLHDDDDTLQKFWKLHTWARSRINEERTARDASLVEWPDLGG